MNKNVTLIFNHFEFSEEHLNKDVFLVPLYLGRALGFDVTVVYPNLNSNANFPKEFNGVKLVGLDYKKEIPFIPLWKHLNFYKYVIQNANLINVLVRFHLSVHTELISLIYKFFNKKGKVYVKLDINIDFLDITYGKKRNLLKRKMHVFVNNAFLKCVDSFSCETAKAFNILKSSKYPELQFGNKLILMPNGFDEILLNSLNIKERKFIDKENIILTVGRLGTSQKNTELLLRALSNVDLDNWKVYLIGSVEESFLNKIEKFYQNNPKKVHSVKFIGPVYDKKHLFEYYNRSKVFVLTSNWEGFPIVYTEAKRFRNYIVSTAIPASYDIIEDDKYGVNFELNDEASLAKILDDIIAGRRIIDVYNDFNTNEISWESIIKSIKF